MVEVIVIVMARNLRMHAVERSRVEGKEEGKAELLDAQKAKFQSMLENGEIDQATFDLMMENLVIPGTSLMLPS